MLESDVKFSGSIPENYDRNMVPLIFQPYAADLARRIQPLRPHKVLEMAAGTGVVTRALAPILPTDASYVVTDISQPMLDWAASRQPADTRIQWLLADAQALPFGNSSFDLVVCQFAAMFFADRVKAYGEARRVLKPGGRFIFSVWDRIEENGFADDVTNALAKLFPADPPRFVARVPHGYYDKDVIRAELAQAGFTNVDIHTQVEQSRAPSARLPAVAICQGTPLRAEIEARDAGMLDAATDFVASEIAAKYGTGEIVTEIRAHVITASDRVVAEDDLATD